MTTIEELVARKRCDWCPRNNSRRPAVTVILDGCWYGHGVCAEHLELALRDLKGLRAP